MSEAQYTVDASGLSCPMPVVKARKAIAEVEPGGLLAIVATDKGALKDIPAWAKSAGHELVDTQEEPGSYRFLVRRKR